MVAGALIIDDNQPLLASLVAQAEAMGLELDTATSWEEGLATYQALGQPLVICDYNLPGSRHGLRLMAKIRELNPSTRLVLFSGYVAPEDVPGLLATGVVDAALIKGSEDNLDRLMEEVRRANQPGARSVTLADTARAYVAAGQVTDAALDELDAILQRKTPA